MKLDAIPPTADGMVIGLYGGSFNPPHKAHRKVALLALKRLKLDQVWWMVTPGNPLKLNNALPPLAERAASARRMARHPRIIVTGLEAGLKTRFTADTIRKLRQKRPNVTFIWIMGADNMVQFDKWEDWQAIMKMIPVAVIDRPGSSMKAMSSAAALAFFEYRVPERLAGTLRLRVPPAWTFLHGVKSSLSSSAIRAGHMKADED